MRRALVAMVMCGCAGPSTLDPHQPVDAAPTDVVDAAPRADATPSFVAAPPSRPVAARNPRAAVQVSVGYMHACVRTEEGQVRCWGSSCGGEVGPDATAKCGGCTASIDPTPPLPALPPVRQVLARHYLSCAVGTDDRVWCWGHGRRGMRGDGVLPDPGAYISVPQRIESVHDVQRVDGGGDYLMVLGKDRGVRTWGFNLGFPLGYETTTSCGDPDDPGVTCSATPTLLPIGVRSNITASDTHACAIDDVGQVVCWGQNPYGQLGDGTTVSRWQAKPVLGLPPVRRISTGTHRTCAIATDGAVYCWGFRRQVGFTPSIDPLPTLITGFSAPVARVEGNATTCALLVTGRVQCWGNNVWHQVGNPSVSDAYVEKPVDVELEHVIDLSVGGGTICAVTEEGDVWCWGSRLVGDAVYVYDASPRKVPL